MRILRQHMRKNGRRTNAGVKFGHRVGAAIVDHFVRILEGITAAQGGVDDAIRVPSILDYLNPRRGGDPCEVSRLDVRRLEPLGNERSEGVGDGARRE
jgi:hypothetical protein